MTTISYEYKRLFKKKSYKRSLSIGIFILILAAIISLLAIGYADTAPGSSLSDLILDNIPKVNFFWFRTFGIALIILSVSVLALTKPKYLPFISKTVGLMYIIRAFFIALTHLKFYPEKTPIPPQYPFFQNIFQGNDLFFSGHVAFPFMISLIFWDNKKIRYTFISLSVISGLVSLFAKTHYSIDVFAAPFITYGIFKIAERLFKKDFNFIKIKI